MGTTRFVPHLAASLNTEDVLKNQLRGRRNHAKHLPTCHGLGQTNDFGYVCAPGVFVWEEEQKNLVENWLFGQVTAGFTISSRRLAPRLGPLGFAVLLTPIHSNEETNLINGKLVFLFLQSFEIATFCTIEESGCKLAVKGVPRKKNPSPPCPENWETDFSLDFPPFGDPNAWIKRLKPVKVKKATFFFSSYPLIHLIPLSSWR